MTDKAEWLASLQVGDPIVVHHASHDRTKIRLIARLTKTLIVANDCRRFRRRDGYKPGDCGYYFSWIEKPTAKAIANALSAAQARKVKS